MMAEKTLESADSFIKPEKSESAVFRIYVAGERLKETRVCWAAKSCAWELIP